jgi:glycosyltransferase involved in cell wall biosynthesis
MLAYPVSYLDGASRFALRLLNALQRDKELEAFALAPAHLGAAPRRPILQIIVGLEQVCNLVVRRPDVVHVHEHPVMLAAAVAYRALTGGSARIVYTVHIEPTEPRAHWKRAILGWLLGHCSVVTAVSADTARRLGRIATPLPRKITVIHGGAEIAERSADDPAVADFRSKYGIDSGPVLCQIGVNFPRKVKGVLRLIETLPRLQGEFPGIRLIIVGDGPLRPTVESRCIELGVRESVTLTGHLDDVSVPLGLTDVYCHITFQDACPLSVLEAMRCGKPIVAAKTGGIPEILEDGVDAVLVQPEQASIAEAISAVLRNKDVAHRLGSQARHHALAKFSWQRVADEFALTYAADAPQG